MPTTRSTRAALSPGLDRVSRGVGAFRWVFMPFGLLALLAVGVHGAADGIDDRIRWVVEQLDAIADGLFAQAELTRSWVDAISSAERTGLARGLAFVWELLVDVVVALPALGYFERTQRERLTEAAQSLRAQLVRLKAQPTPMRLSRPIITAAFVMAGAYAVARMVEAALFHALKAGIVPDGINGPLARIAAVGALVLVLSSLGWRAVLRSLQHADEVCAEHDRTKVSPYFAGWWGTAISLPLALAAFIDTPLLSFFR